MTKESLFHMCDTIRIIPANAQFSLYFPEYLFLQIPICYSHDIIFFLQLHPPNFNTLPFGFIHHFFLLVSPQGTYLIRLKCI